jgi:hypothetical protein
LWLTQILKTATSPNWPRSTSPINWLSLVLGNGTVYSRAQLIESARDRHNEFENQGEMPGTHKRVGTDFQSVPTQST